VDRHRYFHMHPSVLVKRQLPNKAGGSQIRYRRVLENFQFQVDEEDVIISNNNDAVNKTSEKKMRSTS
jgi:hypothetical protein